ncbi:MAG: hypothetical protein O2816_01020 [Planctomycetota bacterium]|nr:hypothetical protein [Planctomycetota bacterium]
MTDRPLRLLRLSLLSALGLCAAISCGGGGGAAAPPGDDGGDPSSELSWDVGSWDASTWE